MDPADYLADTVVRVAPASYVVARTAQPVPDAFATVRVDGRRTVVATADRIDPDAAEAVEPGWRRLTFDAELPFELVGFLATVATALADADVSIFAVSDFATDHLLVREGDLRAALDRLATLGCAVERP